MVHAAIKERYSSINRIGITERASLEEVDRPSSYSAILVFVTKGHRWRQRHRTVMFDIQRVLIFEHSLSTQIMEALGRFYTYGQACDEWLLSTWRYERKISVTLSLILEGIAQCTKTFLRLLHYDRHNVSCKWSVKQKVRLIAIETVKKSSAFKKTDLIGRC